jgi:hypothetical protein
MTFRAPLYLRNAHVQTCVNALPLYLRPRGAAPATHWRRVALPEGGALLAKTWWHSGDTPRPLVVVIHGVGGSSEATYVVRAALALFAAGYHVARLNQRGAGESWRIAPSLYHGGLSDDVTRVVRAYAEDPRVSSVAVFGFSLGGNLVLKTAGEWGSAPPPKMGAVVSVSAPTNLSVVSTHLEGRSTAPYRLYVLQRLVATARAWAAKQRAAGAPVPFDAARLSRTGTLRGYDNQVVAPMHGFPDAEAYYGYASSGTYLPRIQVPTLAVHANDDPMVPGWSVRDALAARSPAVELAWSNHGGHVGWIGDLAETGWLRTWAVDQGVRFLDRVLGSPAPPSRAV